jgi:hypothetical protein
MTLLMHNYKGLTILVMFETFAKLDSLYSFGNSQHDGLY